MNADSYNTNRAAPDLHEQLTNKMDWEKHYLHEDFYTQSVNETYDLEEVRATDYTFGKYM